jgi:hypothetical protein
MSGCFSRRLVRARCCALIGVGVIVAMAGCGTRSEDSAGARLTQAEAKLSSELDSFPLEAERCPSPTVQEGVKLGGPAGDGYCIAAFPNPAATGPLITVISDEAVEAAAGVVYGPCSSVEATAVMRTVFIPASDGTVIFASTTPKADTVAVTGKDGSVKRAKTVSLDSAPGLSFFALKVANIDSLERLDEFDSDGALITKPNEVPECKQ